jgi:ABC-2 type transport system ATP-binding protein
MARSNDEYAIRTVGLSKHFGKVRAVERVDLAVRRGEIYGFLGLNGAGKTTTIRMLLGLVRPSQGEILVCGASIRERRYLALSKVGFLVETATAYPNLTLRENLELQRLLTDAPKGRVGELLELLSLGQYADRRSAHLSLGNKQRLSIARALVSSPELLILDEPANGLDPAGIVEIRNLLRDLADSGITIFMSSHILSEVDQLADRIGIIHQGRLVEELDRRELAARNRRRVELGVDQAEKAAAVLLEKFGVKAVASGNGTLFVDDPGTGCPDIARALVAAGVGIERLLMVEEDLEAHFMRLTGGRE